jgi:lipid A 3-O-deacylase
MDDNGGMRVKLACRRVGLVCNRLLLLLPFLLMHRAQGEVEKQGDVFTFIEENDLVVQTDRHYTQGIRFSYLHEDGFLPFGMTNVYAALPEIGFQSEVGKTGYAVGQNIYTPANTSAENPPPNDRPYAGWLYLGLILQRRGSSVWDHPAQEDMELDLGIIGPWSLAEEAQTWIHKLRGFELPQGWDHQLENEPGVRLRYQRTVRFRGFDLNGFQGEVLPHAGFSLGNVETSLRAGGTVRFGFNLPDDYGLQTIDSLAVSGAGRPMDGVRRSQWSVYAFSSAEGRVVGYNAFLDGNLFSEGPSVEKEVLVGDFKAGLGIAYRAVELAFTQTWRTPEFHGQRHQDSFGSVCLKVRF